MAVAGLGTSAKRAKRLIDFLSGALPKTIAVVREVPDHGASGRLARP
jgi:hypothetical protein